MITGAHYNSQPQPNLSHMGEVDLPPAPSNLEMQQTTTHPSDEWAFGDGTVDNLSWNMDFDDFHLSGW